MPGVATPPPGTPVIQSTTSGDEAILVSECEWSAPNECPSRVFPVTIQLWIYLQEGSVSIFSSGSMRLAEMMVRCVRSADRRPSVKSIIIETIAPVWFWVYLWVALVNTHRWFLALLDYVSRSHEIEISPSSVVRPSSVRPTKLKHGFLSNFSCCFPWVIRSDVFWIFEKKKNGGIFLTNVFRFLSHGTLWEPKFQQIQQIQFPTNHNWNLSVFSWIFFPMVLTKLRLRFLKSWKLKF